MRKGMLTVTMALVLAGAFFLAQTQVTAGTAAAPGPVKISHSTKKGPVTFDHAKHASLACAKCHHKGKEETCFNCHTAEGKDGAPNNKDAMHNRCKACHSAEKKGPTKCGDCHK
ncbi:MAG: cytochrome c3 family protein [Pseudomonadota bacterium]